MNARSAKTGSRAHIVFTVAVFIVLASLDNAAIALIPSMIPQLEETFGVGTAILGVLTATQVIVTAVTAVGWGYLADAGTRKRLLLWGTLIWVIAMALSGYTTTFAVLFFAQVVAGVGLGSIATVGFSVISDFVSPGRRGFAMAFWGLSQGIGTLVGSLVASQAGAGDHSAPFYALAAAGLLFAGLYLFTFEPPRGYREPELAALHASDAEYDHLISPDQLPEIARVRTNRWLVLQGITAQIAYGSLIWVPLLYQEKVIAQGYSVTTGQKVGGLFAAMFTVGALFSILAGHIGDRWQRRNLGGRAYVSAIGILGAIPFFLIFFAIPLNGLDVTEGASTMTYIGEVFTELVTNPWVAAAFVSALFALALTSADSPNWFALIADVNLPEHRGTVFGVGNLVNGVGRGVGTALTTITSETLQKSLTPPLNLIVSLSVFQVFFLPTGWCYWKAGHTAPDDIRGVRSTLKTRGEIPDPGSQIPD